VGTPALLDERDGSHVDPKTLPTWEMFFPARLKDNPDWSEGELKRYWYELYGVLGSSGVNLELNGGL
jgi:hypothetical protein